VPPAPSEIETMVNGRQTIAAIAMILTIPGRFTRNINLLLSSSWQLG
jgi:hypothetical protein